jgi:PEP-CTERM motif
MRRQIIAFGLSCLAALGISRHPAAGGEILTPLQTQSTSTSGTLTPTDWGPGTAGITNPFVFEQFNPNLGKLIAIDLTLTAHIHNDFTVVFVATPTPTTITVATSVTPTNLTDGPTIQVFGPDGSTQIFGGPETVPVDVRTLVGKPPGTYTSASDPAELAPSNPTISVPRTLDASNASSSLLAQFIGTGTADMNVYATAFSSFSSSSGNGDGRVITTANATVTLQYLYTPNVTVPEPSSVILLGLGTGIMLLVCGLCRRAAHPAGCDRA